MRVESGFRADPNHAGLFVPEADSRLREVFTSDERRALNRTIQRVLGPHKLKFLLVCDHPGCPDPKVQKVKLPGGVEVLRCGHADRVLSHAF